MKNNRGFIKIVIFIIIVLAILAYYGFDIKKLIASPEIKTKISFIWDWIKDFWINYIWHWVLWLWEHLGRPLLEKINLLVPKLKYIEPQV